MIGWDIEYDAFDPAQEGIRETLCTLGNGYFATRGAASEACADDVHYPGTYVAGCYDRLCTDLGDQVIDSEDLVNAPNWLPLTFREPGGSWLGTGSFELLAYRQRLDLRRGILSRHLRVRDERGHVTRVESRRIVHMGDPHLAAIEYTLTAENWSGTVLVRSALDGRVTNSGVERYRMLRGDHLAPVEARATDGETVFLQMRTVQSQIHIAIAARTRVFDGEVSYPSTRCTCAEDELVAHELAFELVAGQPVRVEKVIALYTSRDRAISEAGLAAREKLGDTPDLEPLLATHVLAWEHLWRSFDMEISVDNGELANLETGAILRLHVFHLLQTASRSSADLDVGVGARGLHGEAYKGHVFWDELFVFPFLNLRVPDITRALLMYRFRRLDAARRAARRAGYRGALYPWQSGSDGREETPAAYWNPRSGRWIPDHTHLQRHVGAAIAYNVWQYYQITGDLKFLGMAGAEMMLEIARLFASLATYDRELDRYEILGVMGPDEFHSGYPGVERPGVDNNSYTNLMAVWVLWRALDVLELLPHDYRRELCERLALGDDEIAAWDTISRKMRLVFLDGGILAQFEGYDQLRELDWDAYRARYGNIQRLDLILEAEGDTPNRYKVSKQADVLMLFFLFSTEELMALFERLGYPFEGAVIPRTIAYYAPRTSDGSTLSRVAHAWVLARADRERSWQVFREALLSDVADIQGGTTREGIHLGAMAGTVDLLQRCYTGLELREDTLFLNPRLPDDIRCLDLLVRYRTHTLELTLTRTTLEVHATTSELPALKLVLRGEVHELCGAGRRTFHLAPSTPAPG